MGKNIKKRRLQQNNGFTIIEVMIVLAIAALIAAIVFLAIPGVQKSLRNHQRRVYAGLVLAAEQDYYSHYNSYPECSTSHYGNCTAQVAANVQTFITNYLPEERDPSTGDFYAGSSVSFVPGPSPNTLQTSTGSLIDYYDTSSVTHNEKPTVGQILLLSGHVCYNSAPDGTNRPLAEGGASGGQRMAIMIGLEDNQYYCLDTL